MTATRGEGFLLVPLWEGTVPAHRGVRPAWNDAEEAAEAHARPIWHQESDRRWGPHTTVRLHGPLRRWQGDRYR
ncbi:hypothetical protein SCALM49S_00546 [Streptomyces californicus]